MSAPKTSRDRFFLDSMLSGSFLVWEEDTAEQGREEVEVDVG